MPRKNPPPTPRAPVSTRAGSAAWLIAACVAALCLVGQLGPQTLPLPRRFLPADSGAWLVLRRAFDYAFNVAFAAGTLYMAWHVNRVSQNGGSRGINLAGGGINLAVAACIVLSIVALVVFWCCALDTGTRSMVLQGAIASWWVAGLGWLPRPYLDNGLWWFRTVLALKLAGVFMGGI
ncbi:hypothetical protein GGR52DRAFT_536277 [Hypoxylon sp. FL1284]|nr:hypothetical protein GGR52DRAFT_536277 [Hypoxylon sp. FL1284]